jgi:hypothetical protein
MKKILATVILTIMIATTVPAFAIDVNSEGEVTTTAEPPLIKYKWELTEGGLCADFTNPEDCEDHFSCKWVEESTAHCISTLDGYYLVDDNLPKTTPTYLQVMPNPCDESFNTGIKDVRVYTVVWSPYGVNDIANVHVKKYYPDELCTGLSMEACEDSSFCTWHIPIEGTPHCDAAEKEESDAVDITCDGPCPIMGEAVPSEEAKHAIAAAVYYGHITQAQADEILFYIKEKQYKIYREIDKMNCCDPAGYYTVLVRVTGSTGANTEISNDFEYYSIKALKTDFKTVNYGLIPIGFKKWINGDYIFDEGVAIPTLRNNGNDPFKVRIKGTDLINQENNNYKILVNYLDAWFMGKTIDPLAYTWKTFSPTTPSVFARCTDQKIDFSVNAPTGTSSGTYKGSITLEAIAP